MNTTNTTQLTTSTTNENNQNPGSNKMIDIVPIGTKEFFNRQYTTAELMTEKEIADKKLSVTASATKHGHGVEFMESDGVEFYTYTFSENKKTMTTLNAISRSACLSGGDAWKFGFVDANGKINMLFNGKYVVRGRDIAFDLFRVVREYVDCNGFGVAFASKS